MGGAGMTLALVAALLWLVVANVVAMVPTRDRHRRAAFALIAAGIPILGWVTYTCGPVVGLVILAGAASVLRWPLLRLWRAVRRRSVGPAE